MIQIGFLLQPVAEIPSLRPLQAQGDAAGLSVRRANGLSPDHKEFAASSTYGRRAETLPENSFKTCAWRGRTRVEA